MDKIHLTVIIPGIRPENWHIIHEDLKKELIDYTFELICVGPKFPSIELELQRNFRYIRDFGHPSRCLQIGSLFSKGEFISWIPDDCRLEKGGLSSALNFMMNNSSPNDGMCLRYSEGKNFTGNQHLIDSYWVGSTHEDQRLPQVNCNWKIAPLFMYPKKLYFELGGIDCRFEHANLNTHDLAYRVQYLGGKIHLSPNKILGVDWIQGQEVITEAHFDNDVPLFNELYSGDKFPRIKINFDNWMEQPSIWERRFKNLI
jgi:hypothetical protein